SGQRKEVRDGADSSDRAHPAAGRGIADVAVLPPLELRAERHPRAAAGCASGFVALERRQLRLRPAVRRPRARARAKDEPLVIVWRCGLAGLACRYLPEQALTRSAAPRSGRGATPSTRGRSRKTRRPRRTPRRQSESPPATPPAATRRSTPPPPL